MANLETDILGLARKRARLSAHVQRAQTMLAAAILAACGVVAVAAALLAQVH